MTIYGSNIKKTKKYSSQQNLLHKFDKDFFTRKKTELSTNTYKRNIIVNNSTTIPTTEIIYGVMIQNLLYKQIKYNLIPRASDMVM